MKLSFLEGIVAVGYSLFITTLVLRTRQTGHDVVGTFDGAAATRHKHFGKSDKVRRVKLNVWNTREEGNNSERYIF